MFETFDLILPLPFRIIAYLNIGCWLWLLTLKICSKFAISVSVILKFDHHHKFTANHEKLCVNISIVSVVSYLAFVLFHNDQVETLTVFDFIPLGTIAYIFFLLVNPNNSGSKRLYYTFKRIGKGNISSDIRTNDILLSDTLTSYSKTFIDFSIYLCHLFSNKTCLPKNSQSKIDRSCGSSILLDSIIGFLPNLIRLSQCWKEFRGTGNKMHFFNFLKYLTNFPIIIIGLYLKKDSSYLSLWIFASLVNSSYSFYWDVTNDWDLNLFKQVFKTGILRLNLKYNLKLYYYSAIMIDFCLRFIWVLKFLPVDNDSGAFYQIITHLFTTELGLFLLQSLELFRRWVWVFIKIEVEYIGETSKTDIEMSLLK